MIQKPCPVHGKLPVVTYMCCRGAAGGAVRSPRKTKTMLHNIGLAIAANRKKKRGT